MRLVAVAFLKNENPIIITKTLVGSGLMDTLSSWLKHSSVKKYPGTFALELQYHDLIQYQEYYFVQPKINVHNYYVVYIVVK